MEKLLKESVDLLRRMVAVPSPSFEEESVREVVAGFLEGVGIPYELLGNNIIAVNRGYSVSKRTLMLCAHLDTVSPATDYDFDPYCPDYKVVERVLGTVIPPDYKSGGAAEEKVVAGLGSNDDGGSVVAMIAAFRHFYEAELPVNLMLSLSTEEERSGRNGMTALWAALRQGYFKYSDGELKVTLEPAADGLSRVAAPDWAIVGEPTGMKVAHAERGLLVIDAVAEGVSGHAARDEGVNALYIALEDIQRLREFDFEKVSPSMGKVKLTVTQINAGTAHNVIPDRCTFVVDIRPTEQYSNPEIMELLQGVCRSKLKARNLTNRSSATFGGSPLLMAAQACGLETFVSPTTSDWMRIKCDAVKLGPGESSRSHRKNEFVTISEIRDGVEKYIEFIQHFYGYTLE